MNFFRKTSSRPSTWTPSPAFPIGARVVIVYTSGFVWDPWQVDLIGSCGAVASVQDVSGYQLIALDDGKTMSCRTEILRRLDGTPREDLKLGRWADCPWKPTEVRS